MTKYWRHFKTICKHTIYVMRECAACGILFQGITHDLSKFGPTEFISSARYFQGDRSPIEVEKESIGYSKAWLHHKSHNKHHWEYWTDFDDDGNIIANKMPFKYVVEMVCDYIGAGKAYNGEKWSNDDPLKYWNKVRGGRHFHPDTEWLAVIFLRTIASNNVRVFHALAKSKHLKKEYETRSNN